MDHEAIKEELERQLQALRGEVTELRSVEAMHKQTQEGLKAIELQLAGIIHSAMDGIITINEQQHIVLFNSAAEKMFRCSAQDVIGKPIDQFIPEKSREAHRNHIQTFGQKKITSRRMGALGSVNGLRANGEEFQMEASISQVGSGRKKLFTVILRDISERIRIEQQLQESEDRFKTFMNYCPALAWMKDTDGRYFYTNRTFEQTSGITLSDCSGKTDFDLWPNEVAERLQANDQAVLEQNTPLEFQERVPPPDEESKDWLVLKFPVYGAGNTRYIGGFAIDITQRKQLEEQLRKTERLAELGTLASGMAHEIGTPMNVILGRAELLMRKTTDESAKRGLETIVSQVERITKIMNQLLSFARKRPIERRPTDLTIVIKDVLDVLQERIRKYNIQVETALDPDVPKVFADPDQMSQVLLNLVLNACQAMRDGGTLRIGIKSFDSKVELTVADTGCGIPVSNQSRLFDPFFTTKEVGEGTGLGLTVVHGIIEEHEGSIRVESEQGKGATFHILLPPSSA